MTASSNPPAGKVAAKFPGLNTTVSASRAPAPVALPAPTLPQSDAPRAETPASPSPETPSPRLKEDAASSASLSQATGGDGAGEGHRPFRGYVSRSFFRAQNAQVATPVPVNLAKAYIDFCGQKVVNGKKGINIQEGLLDVCMKLINSAEKSGNLSILDVPPKMLDALYADEGDERASHKFSLQFPREGEAFVQKHKFDKTPGGVRISKRGILFVAMLNATRFGN